MNEGFQYGDIIILALIAVFVALRLRSKLGTRIGYDGSNQPKSPEGEVSDRVIQLPERGMKAKPEPEEDALALADIANPEVAPGLMAIKEVDASFRVKGFMEGAKAAFDMIFHAFAKGDKPLLKNLLADELYSNFAAEIDRRAASEEREEGTLVAIIGQEIIEAGMEKNLARVTVRFNSEQIHVLRNKNGEIIGGDPSGIQLVEDEWTFERDVKSRNPNWKIIAT